MAFDGSAWDETIPTNTTAAHQIDDHMQDMKKGVSGRMAREHIWPVSQTATNEAGPHIFVTFAPQTATPTLPVVGTETQNAAIFFTTTHNGIFLDSAGTEFIVFKTASGVVLANGTSTFGDVWFSTTGGGVNVLQASKTGYSLVTNANTAAPKFAPVAIQGWVNMTASATADIISSYNVTTVSRTSEGLFSVVWDSNFADALYCVIPTVSGQDYTVRLNGLSAASANFKVFDTAGATKDPEGIMIMALGT